MRLMGKLAVVTGGGAGIGKAIALRLAEEGADIVIGDIDESAAGNAVAQITALGRRAVSVLTDVTDKGQIESLMGNARQLGRVDILVNNAGVEHVTPPLEIGEAEWDQILAVNLKGTFLCSQVVAGAMITDGNGGKIVNVGSIAGIRAPRNGPHYASSKAGVHMLTKQFALELAQHNVTVNAVAPGVIKNGLSTRHSLSDPERAEQIGRSVPLGRLGSPRDVANAVLFLASAEADYITGTVLPVDGGFLIAGIRVS